ncbi:MAG: hypothetical protein ACP5P4_11340 [Steroidobacteraceae bacterium]
MRNMSFALTSAQIRAGTKTVTRRMGWTFLKRGDLVRPVVKSQGLKSGEKVEVIRAPLRIISVRREALADLLNGEMYGRQECALEGFGDHPVLCRPLDFVVFFCRTHACRPGDLVTRIRFEYTD